MIQVRLFSFLGRAGSDCAPRSRKGRLSADDASSEIQRRATQGATPLGEAVREFGRRKNAARAGALDFRPIWDRRAIGLFQKKPTDEGTRPRSNVKRVRTPTQSRGSGTQIRPFENKTIEAEASACTTLRANGTAPASGYPRAKALPKVRNLFEGAQQFSKVRILENAGDSFEDAHRFARCARKSAPLRRETGSVTGSGRLVHLTYAMRYQTVRT
jgi:hypothetical protein